MKSLVFSLGFVFLVTEFLVHSTPANAMNGGPICNYQRKQAMKAGRAGNKQLADKLWLEYRACTRGKSR